MNKAPLDSPAGHTQGRIRLTRQTPYGPRTEVVERIATKKTAVPGVCGEDCNNGWMSVLENDTKDLLVPHINGRLTTLTVDQQVQIARWACMKSAVFEADTRADVGGLTSPSTRDSIRSGSLPIDMVVTLSAYDVVLSFRALRPYAVGIGQNGQPLAQFVCTWVLGHLVVQVLNRTGTIQPSVLAQAPTGILNDFQFSVWPPQPGSVQWPPRRVLREEDVRDVCTGGFSQFVDAVTEALGDLGPPYPLCPDCGTEHAPVTRELPTT